MSFRSSFLRNGALTCALLATTASPALFAQSSSSADYDAQASSSINTPSNLAFRTQYQNQYPSGGGYHQYKGGDSAFSHIAVEAGVGFATPVSGNNNVNTLGYNILLGGGYNFNKHFGAMIEYNFSNLGIKNSVLEQIAAADPTDTQNGLNGTTHSWNFSLNPVYNIKTKGHFGGYVTAGAGFSRILTSFNVPVFEGYYYDYFYGYIPQYGNATLDHYSSNQAIINGGGGLTWKPNPDQHGAFFADVRYQWLNTPGSSTEIIPVTFGYRW